MDIKVFQSSAPDPGEMICMLLSVNRKLEHSLLKVHDEASDSKESHADDDLVRALI